MPSGPKVKLTIDLNRIGRYFPLDKAIQEGFNYNLIIDRKRYDEVEALLNEYHVSEDRVIQEFCFILLWIQEEVQAGGDPENHSGKLYHVWVELDNLKQYLMHHRITSISLHGEYERNKPGKTLTIREEINIDRICDGIRAIFKDEFHHDKQRRTTKGQRAWQKRKMIKVSNNILNYFTSIPLLDELTLEEQNDLIGRLEQLSF